MARQIGEATPVPPDDPMFKRGARLVSINRFKRSTSVKEKTTDGEPRDPADRGADGREGLSARPASNVQSQIAQELHYKSLNRTV